MRKALGIVLLLVLAFAIVPMVSHADDCTQTDLGRACTTSDGGVALDGASSNPDPLDGFAVVHGDGSICLNDDGEYDAEDATCDPLPA